ncbi:PucR family transcriptional regulator [Nocardioides albidus]|uniref:PucR family transcriptional regulator n=2 Tax=Nocardioides albidus TaxID=1517589 RepID=A0A5C4W3E5_9ACTN|nr:PucR family transcriptional regulator [Nocardioides albidus]
MPAVRQAGPEVVAGAAGLDRPVQWVHSGEPADIASVLRGGDLLLTTGIALPDSDDELRAFATSLSDGEVAGLVIELGRRWRDVPPTLVAACDELGLPLIALAREARFAALAQAVGERIVDEQLDELRDAQRVHDTFTELTITEAGPREILDAAQRLAGVAVVLEGEDHRVSDYRSGPDDIGSFLADWTERSSRVRLEGRTTWDRTQGWLVTRLGRRERRWGRLVIESPTEPPQRLIAVAERAAAALALHRLHERDRDSQVRRTHHELLHGLLNEPGNEEIQLRCELAGLVTKQRHLVGLTLRPVLDAHDASRPATPALDELIAATVHAAHELKVPVLASQSDGDVRALLSVAASADPSGEVDALVARVRRRHPAIAGAGRPVGRLSEADQTLKESAHVVSSVRTPDPARLVHRLEDVHLRGLLTLLGDDDRVRLFCERELRQLREHDAQWGSGLVEALRALVEHPASKSLAAASLHVSRGAFYDRLAKIERVLGASLNDPDIRVSLHVALIAEDLEIH